MIQGLDLYIPSGLTRLRLPLSNARVSVKRDDLIHPIIQGNKWRKLKGYLQKYSRGDYRCILSCGGAYSNHLHATAYACRKMEIPFHVLLRKTRITDSPTLNDLREWSAQVQVLPQKKYKQYCADPQEFFNEKGLRKCLWIPEGGKGAEAEPGVRDLAEELRNQPQKHIFTAVGTGTTAGYLAKHLPEKEIYGLTLFEDGGINDNLQRMSCADLGNLHLFTRSGLGRFGKMSPDLKSYYRSFSTDGDDFLLDPIYTVKLFYTTDHLILSGEFDPEDILLYHSGGLQGRRGYQFLKPSE